ncbi:hypothetical protein [uncultured Muribaculum sp.]|uniref:hypothetical protein n=1 Tax=uncultured Muribaculum sp. TaxID=1918613 RepID=UPI0025AF5ADB|nr:hypothetical protein [uncultured Muribaculum sp.]
MKKRIATVYLRLMKYAMFMGVFGGIATLIGPPRHGLVKASIGIVVGAMLLGSKLPSALKELCKITDEITNEIFRE